MTKRRAIEEILLEWGSHKDSKAYEILAALGLLKDREEILKEWRAAKEPK